MIVAIIKLIGVVVIAAVIIFGIHEILTAPLMPESWDDDRKEYVRCSDCCWTCDDDYSFFGEPGPGCRICPFCHKPGDDVVE